MIAFLFVLIVAGGVAAGPTGYWEAACVETGGVWNASTPPTCEYPEFHSKVEEFLKKHVN